MSGNDFHVTSDWSKEPDPPALVALLPKLDRSTTAGVARGPFFLVGAITLLFWILAYVPDVRQLDALSSIFDSFEPLSALRPELFAMVVNPAQLGALLAALVLWGAGYSGSRALLPVIIGAAVVHSLCLFLAVRDLLPQVGRDLPTVVLALLSAGMAVRSTFVLRKTRMPVSRPGLAWPMVGSLTLVLPLALGRALVDSELRKRGASADLGSPVNLWLGAVGVSALFGLWALVSLVPPYKGRSVVQPVVILGAAAILGFGYALKQASGA